MATTELDLKFFAAGCCYQDERIVLPGSPKRRIRFPALVVRMRHPRLGVILYDTGYAPRVLDHCRSLPERILPWVTEIHVDESQTAKALLAEEGIAPEQVAHVILTHFHVDHVGGCDEFPDARLHLHRPSLERLRRASRWSTMRHGVVSSLLPSPARRIEDIASRARIATGFEFFPDAWDAFGDGSVMMVELPGHADGQLGALLTATGGRRFFLVTDACWVEQAYRDFRMPSGLTRLVHPDFRAYRETLRRLHDFHRAYPEVTIVPSHCEGTLRRLQSEGA